MGISPPFDCLDLYPLYAKVFYMEHMAESFLRFCAASGGPKECQKVVLEGEFLKLPT